MQYNHRYHSISFTAAEISDPCESAIKDRILSKVSIGDEIDTDIVNKMMEDIYADINTNSFFNEALYASNVLGRWLTDKIRFHFYLKSSARHDSLKSISSLEKAIQENSIVDFGVEYPVRNKIFKVQLKGYKGKMDTESFLKFLNEKLRADFSNMIFWIHLQTPNTNFDDVEWKQVCEEINNTCLKSRYAPNEIFIAFNDNDVRDIILPIYPSGSEYISIERGPLV